MILNLSAYKYRNILHDADSPIQSISYVKHQGYEGHNFFAQLKDGYGDNNQLLKLYTSNCGSGTCFKNKIHAYNKAISEAIEIWCFYYLKKEFFSYAKNHPLGFDIDATSSGMGCFPGWSPKSARLFALYEAIERWSLVAWWEGKLFAKIHQNYFISYHKNTMIIEIITPWTNVSMVILKSLSLLHQKPIFAFACSHHLQAAVEKAYVELLRNSRIIDKFYAHSIPLELQSWMERRLVFFSSVEGENVFLDKLHCSLTHNEKNKTLKDTKKPSLIVDSSIPGPWDKYAYIWRCLFDPVCNQYLNEEREDYFYF